MKNSRTNLLKKLCAVSLAAAMLASAGLTEAGTYIGTAVQVDAVTSAPVLPVACEFDFEANEDGSITITKFIGDETNVVIPSKIDGKAVTSIGSYAFYGCTSLKEVTIGNGVTNIGEGAFVNCTNLTDVAFGNSVTNIGSNAFYGTSWYYNQPDGVVYAGKVAYKYKGEMPKNTKITLKDGTIGIAGLAFSDYNYTNNLINLTGITIPDSVTNIGDRAFWGCTNLTDVTIGNGVTSIGKSAFESCVSFNAKIPNSVTNIGDRAFCGCTNLTDVTIGNSVTSIEYGAFRYCTSLKEINVDKNNKNYSSVNGVLFNKDKTTLIQYPEGKTDTEYSIPNSVTSIGDSTFYNCTSLTEVTIGSSVTSIDSDAFYGCTNLKEINVNKNNKNYSSANGVLFNKDKTTLIKYPEGKTDIEYSIPNSVTSIENSAFHYCESLTKVSIGNGVTSIGDRAFLNCAGLKEVTIPDSVTRQRILFVHIEL